MSGVAGRKLRCAPRKELLITQDSKGLSFPFSFRHVASLCPLKKVGIPVQYKMKT